jgi:hypothetical protein
MEISYEQVCTWQIGRICEIIKSCRCIYDFEISKRAAFERYVPKLAKYITIEPFSVQKIRDITPLVLKKEPKIKYSIEKSGWLFLYSCDGELKL